jgi:hypothetical protein
MEEIIAGTADNDRVIKLHHDPIDPGPEKSPNIMDMVNDESEKFTASGPNEFTFGEFENLYNSVLEVQTKGSREVDGKLLRSFPLDMEAELSNLCAWMRRKYKPYQTAREKFALSLGFKVNENTGQFYLPKPKKNIEVSPATKADLDEQNQAKLDQLTTSIKEMYQSLFIDREELFSKIPLKTFNMKQMTDSGIMFPDVELKQPFMEYCVVKEGSKK